MIDMYYIYYIYIYIHTYIYIYIHIYMEKKTHIIYLKSQVFLFFSEKLLKSFWKEEKQIMCVFSLYISRIYIYTVIYKPSFYYLETSFITVFMNRILLFFHKSAYFVVLLTFCSLFLIPLRKTMIILNAWSRIKIFFTILYTLLKKEINCPSKLLKLDIG